MLKFLIDVVCMAGYPFVRILGLDKGSDGSTAIWLMIFGVATLSALVVLAIWAVMHLHVSWS